MQCYSKIRVPAQDGQILCTCFRDKNQSLEENIFRFIDDFYTLLNLQKIALTFSLAARKVNYEVLTTSIITENHSEPSGFQTRILMSTNLPPSFYSELICKTSVWQV